MIAIELRTTCEKCKDPLPINAWATAIPCWSCLHENPLTPEHWSQLLTGAIENAWSHEEGEGTTENLKVGKRSFELRWAPGKAPKKAKPRHRPKEMRAELFPGVVGLAGEETAGPASTENVAFTCTQCGGALSIDGRSREVVCTYCHATIQLSDEAWRRIHPIHAQRKWFLVMEDDGLEVGGASEKVPAREKETSPAFRMIDVIAGRDGLFYAIVEYDKRALVCMDADLTIRWRTDRKGDGGLFQRVAVVGDEVWWVDNDKHDVRRYARADGKEVGKLGGSEPAGARVHHLDVKGATDVVGCPDGTVLALVAHRLVRYDAQGKGILTWPPLGCLMGWLFGEKLQALYDPRYTPDPDDDEFAVRHTMAERNGIHDQFGSNRPTHVPTIQSRMVTAADGSLWLHDGTRVARYGRDGACRWSASLPGLEGAGLTMRPGIDGELNAYVVAIDKNDRAVLFRIGPDGKVATLADNGVGHPAAVTATADGRVLVFGNDTGELRVFDRDGKRLRASSSAVASDRYAAETEDEDEEE